MLMFSATDLGVAPCGDSATILLPLSSAVADGGGGLAGGAGHAATGHASACLGILCESPTRYGPRLRSSRIVGRRFGREEPE